MSLDKKQIRYWIEYYCGGTYENRDIVASLIMKRIEKEQLIIPVIVKSFVCPNGCGQNGDVGSCIECVGK